MDFGLLMNSLVAEAKQSIQIKRMNKFPRFITRLLLLPFSVMALFTVLGYYITLFFYKAVLSPVEHIEKIIHKERDESGWGPQLVVYLFGFPFVFICNVILSVVTISFYFQWFFAVLWLWFATLHGIKWQPILTDASFDEEICWELKTSDAKANKWAKGFFNRILIPGIILFVALCIDGALGKQLGLGGGTLTIIGAIPLIICTIVSVFSYFIGIFFGFKKEVAEVESFEEIVE